ncbi:uncharacterized protein LOC125033227 [Penaeus chinensis]|uniref:uncharacterized protein LOC125033227 n=1 Tax=Penaeus chinensis TaxID=139456 RepID=UPI001FB72DC3|nr:uncharacterized protein LOC125033227 [Penaeus chinensis]
MNSIYFVPPESDWPCGPSGKHSRSPSLPAPPAADHREGSEDLKVLEQFPVERDGNRGQNHVILDRDESGILPVGNTNIKKDAGKVGVEEKGKLGRDRGSAGIFTSIMSNNKGPVAVPTASLLLALALPCLYNRLVR